MPCVLADGAAGKDTINGHYNLRSASLKSIATVRSIGVVGIASQGKLLDAHGNSRVGIVRARSILSRQL